MCPTPRLCWLKAPTGSGFRSCTSSAGGWAGDRRKATACCWPRTRLRLAKNGLKIIETTQDGFKLAEEDLKLRGPGEFFGTRQSGLPDLRMAKLSDVGILELARQEAEKLFEYDPRLKKPEHALLVRELARVWTSEVGEWS